MQLKYELDLANANIGNLNQMTEKYEREKQEKNDELKKFLDQIEKHNGQVTQLQTELGENKEQIELDQ